MAGPGSNPRITLSAHGAGQARGIKTFLILWLMLVILRVTTGAKEAGVLAGLAISATVGLEALVVGPVAGALLAVVVEKGLWVHGAGPVQHLPGLVPGGRQQPGAGTSESGYCISSRPLPLHPSTLPLWPASSSAITTTSK